MLMKVVSENFAHEAPMPPSLSKADKKILSVVEALDFDPIVFSLVMKEDGANWEMDRARDAEKWYRRFLFLIARHPEKSIVPNKDIDAVWHQHILDTEKYFSDCDAVFGKYLHHYPYFGVKDEADRTALESAHDETNDLYMMYFGEDPKTFSESASVCTQSCSQCTHCDSAQIKAGGDQDPRNALSAMLA